MWLVSCERAANRLELQPGREDQRRETDLRCWRCAVIFSMRQTRRLVRVGERDCVSLLLGGSLLLSSFYPCLRLRVLPQCLLSLQGNAGKTRANTTSINFNYNRRIFSSDKNSVTFVPDLSGGISAARHSKYPAYLFISKIIIIIRALKLY